MPSTDPNLPITPIPRRLFGRTGQSVTIIGLGWVVLVALIVTEGLVTIISPVSRSLAATQLAGTDAPAAPADPKQTKEGQPLYVYTIAASGTLASYDEAMAVASLQGIINRKSPEVYLLSHQNTRPQFWLDLLAKDDRWLHGREQKRLADIDALVKLAGTRLKGAVIWDPAVPASVNVATTIAGVQDAVVLSPELANRHLAKWRLPVLELINNACNFAGPEKTADIMAAAIKDRGNKRPGFYFFRCVWVNPANIVDTLAVLRGKHPELNIEVLDPHTFFALFKKSQERQDKTVAR